MAANRMRDMIGDVRIRGCNQMGTVVGSDEQGRCLVHVPALGAVVAFDAVDLMPLDERSRAMHSRRLREVERDALGYLEQLAAGRGAHISA